MVRNEQDFGELAQAEGWEPVTPDPRQWVWTDDYSNVAGAVLRQIRGQ